MFALTVGAIHSARIAKNLELDGTQLVALKTPKKIIRNWKTQQQWLFQKS